MEKATWPIGADTRVIRLANGGVTLVDAADYDWLTQWTWRCKPGPTVAYVIRCQRRRGEKETPMHRAILGVPADLDVDHVNHDGLDNRRSNLRPATPGQNNANIRRAKNNTSGFKGVAWHKRIGRWQAQIQHGKKNHCLGYFQNPEDAAKAYDAEAQRVFGEFAYVNFPEQEMAL